MKNKNIIAQSGRDTQYKIASQITCKSKWHNKNKQILRSHTTKMK